MRVLFVCSGNRLGTVSPIIKSQGNSLEKYGCKVEYFLIREKGFRGYLKSIPMLRRFIKKKHVDLIHAHYSLSAFVATLALTRIPIVVSLMGSDIHLGKLNELLIKIFYKWSWESLIVKSKAMGKKLNIKNIHIIPNGVNLQLFKELNKNECRKYLNYDQNGKYILFLANPDRREKNVQLAKEALKRLNKSEIIFKIVHGIDQQKIPIYLNSANILLLTSLWEGSPNVIKEAMACNCPIVATDVGDIKWVLGNTEGCYIANFDPEDLSRKIELALKFSELKGKTDGRKRIIELGLDSDTIAKKIINIYKKAMKKN